MRNTRSSSDRRHIVISREMGGLLRIVCGGANDFAVSNRHGPFGGTKGGTVGGEWRSDGRYEKRNDRY